MKIATIGYGDRGWGYTYHFTQNGAKLQAICDVNEKKLKIASQEYNLSDEQIFSNEEEFWAAGKLADLLIISTLDQLHYKHVMKAIELGYDILLEKPIASTLKECQEIERRQRNTVRKFICATCCGIPPSS